ncbi:Ig-like domain-containing protein [Lacibacter sp.]|uniref:Ig-like domain-containing protein n=1 Tax=Lacibacter sp. TaxID=1915409 RepID=UPI002B4B0B0E|nr:Ig-like domain-containing protein [Lacibacter sp.]HLP35369.1 Ig-like domain-containing protein [Lacibacter sp.]
MMNKLLHTLKGEKNGRGGKWLWRQMLFLVMFLSAFNPGGLNAQVVPVIDGNPIEWNRGTPGSNFNLFPVKQYQLDAFGNGVVDNQFTEGSKDFFFANQLVWSISQTKSKNDIANGAAIIYNNTLYFAGDRTSNNGDAQIGFWLYLNGTAPTTIGGNNIFSPPHADGDVLVLADFTGGGRNATVLIYQWYSGANPLPPGTSIVPNTNGNLRTSTLQGTVAENNDGQYAIPTGWSFPSATYDYNMFYEGQVDLTGLGFTGANLCNASFLLETRSSQSITASLDDFVGGNFNITPPALVLTGSSVCIGNTGTISSTTSQSGASYQLYNSADQPVGSPKIGDGSGLTWTNIPIGNDYYVVGSGTLPVCTSTSNEVDIIGLANPVIDDQSVCVGSTVDMGPDGTWSSSNTAVATINPTTGVVTGVSAGTSTITYTNANGCTDQAIVTVNANPVVPDQSVCVGATVDMGPDGTWSSSNTAVATINPTTGVVTGVSAGTSTITYTNANGCTDQAIVTVNANPVVPDQSVCVGSTVDMGPDGTWSSSNTAVATINPTTGVVTGVSAGTSTITYTNANGCTDQAIVTVNPNTSSSQRREICANLLPYSWDGLEFTEAGTKQKTGLVNQYGCDSTANYTLVVNPLPVIACTKTPSTIDITSADHSAQFDVDLTGSADTNPANYTYAWTEDGTGSFNFSNIKNPVYTAGPLDAGQVVSVTVTVTHKITGCSSVSECSIPVRAAESCPEVPTSEICNGSTNTYTASRAATANETWKWSVNNGASIDGADNAQSVKVIAGGQSFTLTLTISYANTELSPSECKYEVTVVPCGGYCTYTQGKYGNTSPACDGDGTGDGVAITYPTVVDMIKAMLGVGGVANPLVIGSNGKFITIPSTATAAELLNKSMPGGGGSRELFGSCTVDNVPLPACWTPGTNNTTTYITKQGRINNVLLSQTITLGLNLRVSGGLADFALEAGTFATAKADGGCGSTTPKQRSCYFNELGQLVVVNEYVYKTIPQSIIDALNAGGYDHTVGGLYQLANDALGNKDGETGKEQGASLGDITNAVGSINEGFDECRIFIGWSVGPCEVPSGRININSSGVINSADLAAQTVESLRVSAYPNPFAEKVSFAIVSPVSGKASLEIYNMFGQKIQTVYEGYLTAGRTQLVEFRPGSTIAAGTLVYRLNVAGKQVTGKLVNLKQ